MNALAVMDIAIATLLLILGAVFGGLIVYAWLSDDRPIADQFNEMHHTPENVEARARRAQS